MKIRKTTVAAIVISLILGGAVAYGITLAFPQVKYPTTLSLHCFVESNTSVACVPASIALPSGALSNFAIGSNVDCVYNLNLKQITLCEQLQNNVTAS